MSVDTPDFMAMTQLAAPVLLGIVKQLQGSTVASGIVNSVPFQTGWVVVFNTGGIVFTGASVGVSDNYSGVIYMQASGVGTKLPPLSMPLASVVVGGLTILVSPLPINNTGFDQSVAFVFGLFGVGVQAAYNTPHQPLYVKQTTDPLPIGYANDLQVLHVSVNLAAAGSATLLAGIAGNTVVVYGYDLTLTPIGAVVGAYTVLFEDTTAAVQFASPRVTVQTAVGIGTLRSALDIPQGLRLPIGAGIKAVANAANVANSFMDGVLLYTQGAYV